jgi:2-polyprenyl-3-methyl-5-hydroxy-6-metoxy-1,4-benzoquinol methylase
MPDFSKRSTELEIMDDLEYAGPLMDRTLYELEVINKWLGGNQVTIGGLQKLLGQKTGKSICIADLGCGRGDMLRLIDAWAKKNNKYVKLVGIDANPYIINAAKQNLKDFPHIDFQDINIYSPEFQAQEFDVVIGTLFYHHFSDNELVDFFRQLKNQVKIGIIINDIHRHPLAYHSIRVLTSLFSRSSMVKFDAPLSVKRAFKKQELVSILKDAGIETFTIRWKWAFRWQVLVYAQ